MVDDELKTMGMALGCAVKVIASTCVATGQPQLGRDILQMWKDEEFDRLAATFEVMAASHPMPDA